MVKNIPTHFSEVLKDYFHKRSLKNASYSLRAYARDLGLPSGTLSNILKRKSGLSLDKANEVATILKMKGQEKLFFCKLVEANCSRKKSVREKAKHELLNYNTDYICIDDDHFKIIADWYHFALVELVRIVDFKYDIDWMAERLGITTLQCKMALKRLIKIGLVREENDTLIQNYDYFASPSGTPSEAVRQFHKQIMTKAISAVDTQTIEERNITSGFLRVRTSDLPLIGQKIHEFRRTMASEIESGEGHDSVYAFGIQFFRGDKSE